jgi:hypothetical protein
MLVWSLYYISVDPTPGFNGFLCPVPMAPMSVSLWSLCMIPFCSFAWFPMVPMPVTQWFPCLIPIGFFWFLMSPMSMSVSLQFLNLTSLYCACFPRFPIDWFLRALGLFPVVPVPGSLRFLYLVPSASYVRFPIVFISSSPWFLCPIPYGFYIWFPLVPMPHSPWFLYLVPSGSYAPFPMVFISGSLWFLCPIPYGFMAVWTGLEFAIFW